MRNKDVSGQNTGLNNDQLTKMYEFYSSKMNRFDKRAKSILIKKKKAQRSNSAFAKSVE
jgi:hypothetical protein